MNQAGEQCKGSQGIVLVVALAQKADEGAQEDRTAQPGCQEGVDEEEEEGLVVQQAHTIGYPNTVVVHLEHAPASDAVVVCPWGFPRLQTPTRLVQSGLTSGSEKGYWHWGSKIWGSGKGGRGGVGRVC